MSERVYGLGRGPWHDKCVGFGVRRPGCQIAQISAQRWGAAIEDNVAICVHGVSPLGAVIGDEVAAHVHGCFSLPMGMEREDRCK